jgi:hypothetical protein
MTTPNPEPAWDLYTNNLGDGRSLAEALPPPPPWRRFDAEVDREYDVPEMPESQRRRGHSFRLPRDSNGEITSSGRQVLLAVNAALHLRRPLLVTGQPGVGKSSLAYSIANELGLGRVLWWPITPRTELEQGLYRYDALDRLRDSNDQAGKGSEVSVDDYITLGPLGTAFIPLDRPRVLLIDEIDKSDLQLPNELLHLFEEGSFPIPQLQRAARGQEKRNGKSRAEVVAQVDTDDPLQSVRIKGGMVQCRAFPIVVMTSNNERDFPPAFYRRCIRIEMLAPSQEAALHDLIENQFADDQQFVTRWPNGKWKDTPLLKQLIQDFLAGRGSASLEQRAIDQFLNAAHLLMGVNGTEKDAESLRQILFRSLTPDR